MSCILTFISLPFVSIGSTIATPVANNATTPYNDMAAKDDFSISTYNHKFTYSDMAANIDFSIYNDSQKK